MAIDEALVQDIRALSTLREGRVAGVTLGALMDALEIVYPDMRLSHNRTATETCARWQDDYGEHWRAFPAELLVGQDVQAGADFLLCADVVPMHEGFTTVVWQHQDHIPPRVLEHIARRQAERERAAHEHVAPDETILGAWLADAESMVCVTIMAMPDGVDTAHLVKIPHTAESFWVLVIPHDAEMQVRAYTTEHLLATFGPRGRVLPVRVEAPESEASQ